MNNQASYEWEATFNAISDFVFVLDMDNRFLKVNKAFAEIFNLSPRDLEGRKCYEVVHKSGRPWPECPFEMAKLDNKPHSQEVIDRAAGLALLVTVSPIFDDKGKMTGVVHISKDISERKKIEDALRASEERYRSLVNNLNIGIYRNTADEDGRFLEANPAMAGIFGYDSLEDFLKKSVVDLYQNKEDRKAFLAKLIENGSIKSAELKLKKKDGTPIWCSITAVIHRNEEGKIDWVDGVLENITEHKKRDEELMRKMDSMEKFRRVTVDRELKMKELKARIAQLEAERESSK